MGVERLINHRLGVRRKDDTLPDRWFDEPNPRGPYKGERIDRQEFDAMLSRFYEISRLTSEGVPQETWRKELVGSIGGVMDHRQLSRGALSAGRPVDDRPRSRCPTVGQLIQALDQLVPGMAKELDDPLYNIAVNDEILLHSVDSRAGQGRRCRRGHSQHGG